MILAETAPTGIQWNGFLTVCGFLAFFAANLATVWAVTRKQKREIHFGFEPASKAEFDRQAAANEQVHRDLFSKLGGVERGSKAHTDSSVERLSEQISKMGRNVASLDTETKNQNAWLERIDKKLDDRTVRAGRS